MIIILEHCPMRGKDDGSYDSLTSWDKSPDFKETKRGQRSPNKEKGPKKPKQKEKKKKKEEKKKMGEKERKDNATISFSTLVLQSSTMIFIIESLLCCHFHILVGIFHYITWLLYSNDGLPQIALGWMHTHLVSF